MPLEKQTTFGWLVGADLFLAGTGGGVFFVSYLLDVSNRYGPLSETGTTLGPLLVLTGGVFLLMELRNRSQLYRLFSNPSSWMSRGTWCMVFFIIFGLGYSLPSFSLFSWLPWSKTSILGSMIGTVAAIASVAILIYPGLLLAVIKRIPFWNTPALPLLFLFSGLGTGIACLLLISFFSQVSGGQEMIPSLHPLLVAEVILILTQIVVLGAYLEVSRHVGISSLESVRSLKTLLFIGVVLLIGLIIPLCLLLGATIAGYTSILFTLVLVASVCLLIGGVFMRYSIISAGVYLPLYTL